MFGFYLCCLLSISCSIWYIWWLKCTPKGRAFALKYEEYQTRQVVKTSKPQFDNQQKQKTRITRKSRKPRIPILHDAVSILDTTIKLTQIFGTSEQLNRKIRDNMGGTIRPKGYKYRKHRHKRRR